MTWFSNWMGGIASHFFPDQSWTKTIIEKQALGIVTPATRMLDHSFTVGTVVHILVPFIEELAFRGFILGFLISRFKPIPAIFISSALFAFIHVGYGWGYIFPMFCMGIALASITVKFGIIYSIFAHALLNWTVLLGELKQIDYYSIMHQSPILSGSIIITGICVTLIGYFQVTTYVLRNRKT